MNGFVIEYVTASGERELTWMGEPMASPGMLKTGTALKDAVAMMFGFAHPDCELISLKPCTLDEFTKHCEK